MLATLHGFSAYIFLRLEQAETHAIRVWVTRVAEFDLRYPSMICLRSLGEKTVSHTFLEFQLIFRQIMNDEQLQHVAAYAVYRNLVNVSVKTVPKLNKNRRRNQKKKKTANRASNNEFTGKRKQGVGNSLKGNENKRKGAKKNNMIGKQNKGSLGINNQSLNIRRVQKSTMKSSPVSMKKKQKNACENFMSCIEPVESNQLPDRNCGDSFIDGQNAFSWLIHPISPDEFFRSAWEKRPLHIRRRISNYYSSLLSTKAIDQMLREHNVFFSKNLDITSYVNGKRETLNPVGRAYPAVVWDFYNNGNSVRLLNPQTFIDKIWKLNSVLQDMFGCFVGANVYLTPPDSQGFAPHYDDIEAFILQVEGKKHWRLYAPLSSKDWLPRYSSENFPQEAVNDPILDVVLEPGDLLYFPRGVIHQGVTLPGEHSLHITISSYQKNTWGDLLEKLVPVALKIAIEEDPEFRTGLPPDYLRYMGVAHSDFESDGRRKFIDKVSVLMKRLFDYAPFDAAVDQMGKQLMHDALPPYVSPEEASCTVLHDGEKMSNGVVTNRVEFDPDVRIKLLRGNVLRLVTEEESVRIYHCVENSREYHLLEEPQFVEISAEMAPAVEFLIHSYPSFVSVEELPLDSEADKIQLAFDLWEKRLLMTEKPLDTVDSD